MEKPEAPTVPARLVRIVEVVARTGLSRASLYRRIAAGTFPAAVSLGGQSVAWREADLVAWIEARPAARTVGPIPNARPHAERAQSSEVPAVPVAQAAGRHARARR